VAARLLYRVKKDWAEGECKAECREKRAEIREQREQTAE
jgi:hypothetical protein